MRPSRALAIAAYVGVVPGCIWLAYAGYQAGIYPYQAVPFAFGIYFALIVGTLLVLLPKVRRRLG